MKEQTLIYFKPYKSRIGFTLIELSISIIIIGLILSCIFIGTNMYKAAKIRTIITEHGVYKTAIVNFKNTYRAVPGDMSNATSVLTLQSGAAVAGNGNGNNLVDSASEYVYLPQHLQAAGFITGYYDGATQLINSANLPNAWGYQSFNQVIFNMWRANETNLLYYNKNGNTLIDGSISPIDAAAIDNKIDDGNAISGYVYVMVTSNSYDCIRSPSGSPTGTIQISTYTGGDANYNLSNSSSECELLFGSIKE